MKTNIFVLVFILLGVTASSQNLKFGAGPAISLPTNNSANPNSLGVGAELTAVYPFAESFEAFGQVGYHYFFSKELADLGQYGIIKSEALSHVPLLVGARYVNDNFLGGIGIGYGFYSNDNSGFTFSPQVGYRLKKLDVILHYTVQPNWYGSAVQYFGLKSYLHF